ncbi:MAG: TonB-dependent receptor [Verrucomicrobiota bacterium JB022]|nr:TonB-dependent receptor [Verrucomicrobiota bacterium JB022]
MKKPFMPLTLIPLLALPVWAEEPEVFELAPIAVTPSLTANETPASGFELPVTLLRYETRVDVQSRGLAETQADVSIRGGIFENTSFTLGALPLYDPQTGHYFAELPVDPHMLRRPTVMTGVAHALGGFNATSGTVAYQFAPIDTRGELSLGYTLPDGNSQSLYQGYRLEQPVLGRQLAVDFGAARSLGDGTVDRGDYQMERLSGRVQLRGEQGQTDVFAAYMDKEYGWPNMYTGGLYGTANEYDAYEVFLTGFNHQQRYGEGSELAVGGYYRSLLDDYEFNRDAPNNAFEHETRVWGGGVQGRHVFGPAWALVYSSSLLADTLESTGLTHGKFMSRTYWSVDAAAEYSHHLSAESDLSLLAGTSYLETNRDKGTVSPLARVAWQHRGDQRTQQVYAEVAGDSQVMGYTALNSSETGGLFRGNRALGPVRTTNYEFGYQIDTETLSARAAIFYRTAQDFVDWVYITGGTGARYARAFDVDTTGVELMATRRWEAASATLGYAYLDKDPELGSLEGGFDASFYGLNYAEHRLTLSGVLNLPSFLEWRADVEAREQEENALRQDGDRALLISLGLTWNVQWVERLSLDLVVDNVLNTNFQDLPGTPGEGRSGSLRAIYRW